jgi:hypothetical protein
MGPHVSLRPPLANMPVLIMPQLGKFKKIKEQYEFIEDKEYPQCCRYKFTSIYVYHAVLYY